VIAALESLLAQPDGDGIGAARELAVAPRARREVGVDDRDGGAVGVLAGDHVEPLQREVEADSSGQAKPDTAPS
jgi:hypothetical protein